MVKSDRCVYVLFRPDNGEPFYVGKGSIDRPRHHFRCDDKSNLHKNNIILKFKRNGLDVPSVFVREGLSNYDSGLVEIALISAIGRYPHGPLVNMTDGGEGTVGYKFSDESRARVSVASSGRKYSAEVIEKRNKKLMGQKRSEKSIQRMRDANARTNMLSTKRDKCSAASLGKQKSEAHKAALREAWTRRSRVASPETRAKISAAGIGRVFSEESREKMRASAIIREQNKRAACQTNPPNHVSASTQPAL